MLSASLIFLYPEVEGRNLLRNVVPSKELHGVKFYKILILTIHTFQKAVYQALANYSHINTITGILS